MLGAYRHAEQLVADNKLSCCLKSSVPRCCDRRLFEVFSECVHV